MKFSSPRFFDVKNALTFYKIVREKVVAVRASQGNVVHVAMSVDEARGDDLVCTIHGHYFHTSSDVRVRVQVWLDLCDPAVLDQEVGLDASGGIVWTVDNDDAVLQQRPSCHVCNWMDETENHRVCGLERRLESI